MKAVILATLILVVVNVGACSDEDTITPTNDKLPITMDLKLDETVIPVGSWVSARILLTTSSDSSIALTFGNSCRFGYEVYSGVNKVMTYPIDCTGEPGTVIVRNVGVTAILFAVPTIRYDMENVVKHGVWELGLDQLPVGEYRLRAGLIGYKTELPWAETRFTMTK